MLTLQGKSTLFLSSYSPLFVILALRQYDATVATYGQFAGIAILLAGFIVALSTILPMLYIFRDHDRVHGRRRKLDGQVESVEKDALLYFVTYVIPFVGVGRAGWTDLVSYLIVFFVIYSLYVRAGLVYLNPMLSLCGFRIYKIATADRNAVLITKKAHRGGVNAEMIEITDGVYYEPKH